jgi:hypothetical protein
MGVCSPMQASTERAGLVSDNGRAIGRGRARCRTVLTRRKSSATIEPRVLVSPATSAAAPALPELADLFSGGGDVIAPSYMVSGTGRTSGHGIGRRPVFALSVHLCRLVAGHLSAVDRHCGSGDKRPRRASTAKRRRRQRQWSCRSGASARTGWPAAALGTGALEVVREDRSRRNHVDAHERSA